MYDVVLSPEARRTYDRAQKPLRWKLDRCFDQLKADPYNHPQIKILSGPQSGRRRYRVGGKWRMVYEVAEQIKVVDVVDIENRDAVYKKP